MSRAPLTIFNGSATDEMLAREENDLVDSSEDALLEYPKSDPLTAEEIGLFDLGMAEFFAKEEAKHKQPMVAAVLNRIFEWTMILFILTVSICSGVLWQAYSPWLFALLRWHQSRGWPWLWQL